MKYYQILFRVFKDIILIMAIIKLSAKNAENPAKSQKAVLIFTDEGTAYVTSRAAVKMMAEGTWKGDFIHLTKLPIAVDPSRFKKSEVYDKTGTIAKSVEGKEGKEWDGLGTARKKLMEEVVQYTDKNIW